MPASESLRSNTFRCLVLGLISDRSVMVALPFEKISLARREEVSQPYTGEKGWWNESLTFQMSTSKQPYNSLVVLPGHICVMRYASAVQDHCLSCNPNLQFILLSHNGDQTWKSIPTKKGIHSLSEAWVSEYFPSLQKDPDISSPFPRYWED